MTGYEIAMFIESRWEREGRRSRFLFWTFRPMIGLGSLYRTLNHLLVTGVVVREARPDPNRPPRFVYRIKKDVAHGSSGLKCS